MPELDRAQPPSEASPGISATILALGFLVIASLVVAGYLLVTRTGGSPDPSGSGAASSVAGGSSRLDPDDIVDVIPMDGIPAIDEPRFEGAAEVDWLADEEPVIAFEIDGDARAYPLQIMTWHEIVNDVVGDTPVAVTFCPLCNTALAYERPEVDGEVTTFGTSGKLINSNLLMYDRATESLWPQVTGEALVGTLEGQHLVRHPARIVSWQEFRAGFPDGKVLSRETGHDRRYGENPYPGYDDVDSAPFLFRGEVDGRLAAVERVLGFETGGEAVAFPYFRLEAEAMGGVAATNTEIGGEPVAVFWKSGTTSALDDVDIATSRDVGAAAAYSGRLDDKVLRFSIRDGAIIDRQTGSTWNLLGRAIEGRLSGRSLGPLEATDSFWFDWAAFHPDTEIWQENRS